MKSFWIGNKKIFTNSNKSKLRKSLTRLCGKVSMKSSSLRIENFLQITSKCHLVKKIVVIKKGLLKICPAFMARKFAVDLVPPILKWLDQKTPMRDYVGMMRSSVNKFNLETNVQLAWKSVQVILRIGSVQKKVIVLSYNWKFHQM